MADIDLKNTTNSPKNIKKVETVKIEKNTEKTETVQTEKNEPVKKSFNVNE